MTRPPRQPCRACRIETHMALINRHVEMGDHEAAHGAEDEMRAHVLRNIAALLCWSPEVCASAALKSTALDFERWCA